MRKSRPSRYLFFLLLFALFLKQTRAQQLDSLTLDTMRAFTSLQAAMKIPDKVIKLVLRKQKFKTFPPEISLFKNLQYLDLGKNLISSLPPEIDSLRALQVLILSKNKLESLPDEIGRLKNLRILNVNQNDLISLPGRIGELENLEYLDLWSNNIGSFPEQLRNLDKLKVLDLRVIMIDDDDQHRIKTWLPSTKIYFSPGCKCKTQ